MSKHTQHPRNKEKKMSTAETLPRIAYTVGEVAAMLGRTENAIYLAIRDGSLPSRRIAGRVMVPANYFENLGVSVEK